MKLKADMLATMRTLTATLRNQGPAAATARIQAALGVMTNKFAPTATPSSPPAMQVPAFVTDLLGQLKVGVPSERPDAADAPCASPHSAANASANAGGQTRAGQFIAKTYAGVAGARGYKLFIPSGYAGEPLPLVVMLHGCTQNPDDFATGTRANEVAEQQNCFVAYPAQSRTANSSMCWNWFQPTDQKAGAGEPAIIAGIARQIMTEYRVDKGCVYIAGLSAGGAMAAITAAAYPEIFAAVGVHSGLPVGSAVDLPSALAAMRDGGKRVPLATHLRGAAPTHMPPMIVFHGNADKTVHPRNADALIAQCVAGRRTQTIVKEQAKGSARGHTCALYVDEKGMTLAEQWTIHNAGHAWAGGSQAGTYTDPNGPDATREMMSFFRAHPLRIADSETVEAA